MCFVFAIFFFVFWLHHVETCVLYILNYQFISLGNFLVVQWVGFGAFTAQGLDSIPGSPGLVSYKPFSMARGEKKRTRIRPHIRWAATAGHCS